MEPINIFNLHQLKKLGFDFPESTYAEIDRDIDLQRELRKIDQSVHCGIL